MALASLFCAVFTFWASVASCTVAVAAASATVELSSDSQKVNAAQNRLAKATGAEVGDR